LENSSFYSEDQKIVTMAASLRKFIL